MFFGISILVFSLISIMKIPPKEYSNFVFWNLEPFLLILCVLSTVVHLVSLISMVGFSKCWHGSITFLIFVLFGASIISKVLAGKIDDNIERIIPTLVTKREFGKKVQSAAIELNCSSYEIIKDFPFDVLFSDVLIYAWISFYLHEYVVHDDAYCYYDGRNFQDFPYSR